MVSFTDFAKFSQRETESKTIKFPYENDILCFFSTDSPQYQYIFDLIQCRALHIWKYMLHTRMSCKDFHDFLYQIYIKIHAAVIQFANPLLVD